MERGLAAILVADILHLSLLAAAITPPSAATRSGICWGSQVQRRPADRHGRFVGESPNWEQETGARSGHTNGLGLRSGATA